MNRTCRIVLLALLFAALPMRGYAGVLMSLCEAHHGGVAAAQKHVHEEGDSQRNDSGDSGEIPAHIASVCSICASCCAGGNLALDAPLVALPQAPGSDRITFFDRRPSGFVPEHLDRPPLAS